MSKTMILTPFDSSCFDEQNKKIIKENAVKIKEHLDNMKYEDISFEDFLNKLQFTEDSYILAIRYTLMRDTLFLKRQLSEIRINIYNTNLLKAWQANMDIQYVLDPYACATYTLSYITKGQRGMSKLLEKASEEAKSGNKDIKNRVIVKKSSPKNLLANCRPTAGRLSANRRATVGLLSLDCRPTVGQQVFP